MPICGLLQVVLAAKKSSSKRIRKLVKKFGFRKRITFPGHIWKTKSRSVSSSKQAA